MIKQLTIKNLAIIDDISIDFEDNLNVLTGETGAGKSIIIDAIDLIFGKRADVDLIAFDKDFASITATIYLNDFTKNMIQPLLDIDINDEFIINRTINRNGRSFCKINGVIVPLFTLNQISDVIVDISSQNESQFLLNEKNHLSLLDTFIESSTPNFKKSYQETYNEYKNIKDKIEEIKSNSSLNVDMEYLNFKYKEIKDYNYSIEDEEKIFQEYKDLQNASKNISIIKEICELFDGDDGINSKLYASLKAINKLNLDEKIYDSLNSIYADFEDFSSSFSKKFNVDNFNEERIEFLSNEITKINSLKRKYNVDNLLNYKENLKSQIDLIENLDETINTLEIELKEKEKELKLKAKNLNDLRHNKAIELSKNVEKELHDLYLNDAKFSLNFNLKDYNIDGNESCQFMMSANKGVEPCSLIKVASGGEVSRIMLGLKAVFCKLFKVDIVIFDEIDTGVAGKVALAMGKKMQQIALNSQVLAITHLPQVAAMSDHHYFISKAYENNKTKTNVKKLNEEEKIKEIARLLSGDEIKDVFIASAKELISFK